MSRHNWDGRLFHTSGPAAVKPKVLCVRGTTHGPVGCWSATRLMSSAKYAGAKPDSDWCARHAILKSTRRRTGSHCNWRRTCMMWSYRLAPVMSRAAAFWIDWSFRMRSSDTPYNSELQQSRRQETKAWINEQFVQSSTKKEKKDSTKNSNIQPSLHIHQTSDTLNQQLNTAA